MNRTEQAMRRTLAAVGAPLYDLGILTDRGMFPRMDALTAAQCIARLPYLKYRNANGAHIYFRPSGERRFTLLDDLTPDALDSLSAHGFEPCAVIETSPGNFQAWLMHSHIMAKELGTFAAQRLAERFGADPSAADWRRFGRLPGFTNRKPQYRQRGGLFPFVRLDTGTGQQFTAADVFDPEANRLHQAYMTERQQQRQSFRPWFGRSTQLALARFRSATRYVGRPAAADMAFSIAAFANGWTQSQVADALASEYLSRNPSPSRRAAYIRRTTSKACSGSEPDRASPPLCRFTATRENPLRFLPILIPPLLVCARDSVTSRNFCLVVAARADCIPLLARTAFEKATPTGTFQVAYLCAPTRVVLCTTESSRSTERHPSAQ